MIDETRYSETVMHTEPRPRIAVAPGVSPGYAADAVEYRPLITRLVAWGPVWAGVVVAISIQAVLTVLGMAIGLTVIASNGGADASNVSIGAGIWWVLTGIISLFLGGMAAGTLASPAQSGFGALHGFIMWCTVTVLSAVLVTSLGGAVLGGGLSMMGSTLNYNSNSNSPIARNAPRTSGETFNQSPSENNPNNPVNPNDNASLSNRLNNPQDRATAERAAKASAAASWWTFAALILGAAAATVGGSMSRTHDDSTRIRRTT